MIRLTNRRPATQRPHNTLRASWLSLFAMLMMFVGPLISQSMPMQHRMASAPSMTMAMPGHMAMEHGSHNDGQLHVMWEKCGYCSLFLHCPALPQAHSPLLTEATPPANGYRAEPRSGHARQTVFPGARSRAPPVFALS